MSQLCNEEQLVDLMQKVESDPTDDVSEIDILLTEFPDDPRLHFLRGSILAGSDRLVEAHSSMKHAVDLAPQFHIARFQLGFFELSSGEPQAAIENWKQLADLPEQHYLRYFVNGLTFLIQDEFQLAVNNLQSGMTINKENPPLNHDMQLIVEKCNEILSGGDGPTEEDDVSSTSLLLNQFGSSNKPN